MARGPRKRKAIVAAQPAEPSAEEPTKKLGKKKRRSGVRNVLETEDDSPSTSVTEAAKRLAAWAESSEQVGRWLASRGGGLEAPLLDAKGGVLRLRDYLPLKAADAVLSILEGLPEEAWELSKHAADEGAAKHRFWSADVCDVAELAPLRSVFWRILPAFRGEPTLPIISCGRYQASDFIGRHDDRAHVPFFNGDKIYSRTVAAIWYLTRDWSESDGGRFVDFQATDEASKELVPIYNSFVAFEVPHLHAVSAVSVDRYRYSIFGWWHQQGERYELPGPSINPVVESEKRGKKRGKRRATSTGEKTPVDDDTLNGAESEAGQKDKAKMRKKRKLRLQEA